MARLDDLTQKVRQLYEQKLDSRADWADWIYENHVFVVAEAAQHLADKYKANTELTQAAAMLHDIADYKVQRHHPDHEAASLSTARQLMKQCGYTSEEIALTVDDAIRYHSCHDDERPKSTEGLILATADSLAHLQTDFYVFATWMLGREGILLKDLKAWTLKKIDRDFNNKISFDEERELARPDYELIKDLFSR